MQRRCALLPCNGSSCASSCCALRIVPVDVRCVLRAPGGFCAGRGLCCCRAYLLVRRGRCCLLCLLVRRSRLCCSCLCVGGVGGRGEGGPMLRLLSDVRASHWERQRRRSATQRAQRMHTGGAQRCTDELTVAPVCTAESLRTAKRERRLWATRLCAVLLLRLDRLRSFPLLRASSSRSRPLALLSLPLPTLSVISERSLAAAGDASSLLLCPLFPSQTHTASHCTSLHRQLRFATLS